MARTQVTRVCEYCGVAFERVVRRRFCSKSCAIRNRRTRPNHEVCICQQCGITFEPPHQDSRPARLVKFCSRACSGKYHRLEKTTTYRGLHRHGKAIRLHQLRAEVALGHQLPPLAEVHHADGTKSDTSPLVICQDRSYHLLLHRRMRIKAAGGNPNTDSLCGMCHVAKPLSEFDRDVKSTFGVRSVCIPCRRAYRNSRYAAMSLLRQRSLMSMSLTTRVDVSAKQ